MHLTLQEIAERFPESERPEILGSSTVTEMVDAIHAALIQTIDFNSNDLRAADPDVLESLKIELDITEMNQQGGARVPVPTPRYLAVYCLKHFEGQLSLNMLRVLGSIMWPVAAMQFLYHYLNVMMPDVDARNFLFAFLQHTKVLPRGFSLESFNDPVDFQQVEALYVENRIEGRRKATAKDWNGNKARAILKRLEPLRKECHGPPGPQHVASVLTHLLWNGAKDVMKASSSAEAILLATLRLQQSFQEFMEAPNIFLAKMGLFPVGDEFPEEERALRQAVGEAIRTEVEKNLKFRRALIAACKDVLPFFQLVELELRTFWRDDQDPYKDLFLNASRWLENAGVERPKAFLKERIPGIESLF